MRSQLQNFNDLRAQRSTLLMNLKLIPSAFNVPNMLICCLSNVFQLLIYVSLFQLSFPWKISKNILEVPSATSLTICKLVSTNLVYTFAIKEQRNSSKLS